MNKRGRNAVRAAVIVVLATAAWAVLVDRPEQAYDRPLITEGGNRQRMLYLKGYAEKYAADHEGNFPADYSALASDSPVDATELDRAALFIDPDTREFRRSSIIAPVASESSRDPVIVRSPVYSLHGKKFKLEVTVGGAFVKTPVK